MWHRTACTPTRSLALTICRAPTDNLYLPLRPREDYNCPGIYISNMPCIVPLPPTFLFSVCLSTRLCLLHLCFLLFCLCLRALSTVWFNRRIVFCVRPISLCLQRYSRAGLASRAEEVRPSRYGTTDGYIDQRWVMYMNVQRSAKARKGKKDQPQTLENRISHPNQITTRARSVLLRQAAL